MMKMRNIFGGWRERKLGCGFLSQREIDALIEGRLQDERASRFDRHRREGCAECLHLGEAVEVFRGIVEQGALELEKARFQKTARGVKARLRMELEEREAADAGRSRFGLSWSQGLSAEELQQIAAGRETRAVDDETSGLAPDPDRTDLKPGPGGPGAEEDK